MKYLLGRSFKILYGGKKYGDNYDSIDWSDTNHWTKDEHGCWVYPDVPLREKRKHLRKKRKPLRNAAKC